MSKYIVSDISITCGICGCSFAREKAKVLADYCNCKNLRLVRLANKIHITDHQSGKSEMVFYRKV